MASGQVSVRGRFAPGARVRLVRVRDERVLRAEGGEEVAVRTVDKDGRVQFKDGVEVDARYFVCGYAGGTYVELRARGRSEADGSVLGAAPFPTDRVRLSDGSWADEAPARESAPVEGSPHLGLHQVPEGTALRSATLRGSAHPVDPADTPPTPAQADVKAGVPQMSQTQGGEAAPVVAGAQSQSDVPDGVAQRSETERGVAVPLPAGGGVRAQLDRESPVARVARGEPGRAAAEPLAAAETAGKRADRSQPRSARKSTRKKAARAVAKPKTNKEQ